jgi:UDP-N-acetylmuramoyl-L-alanyl-D-glutamate--2,6-diaminopimelate ligase
VTRISLDAIASELGGRGQVRGSSQVCISGLSQDSRKITVGDLFIARKGGSLDGAQFIEQAIANGAAAILVSERDLERVPLGLPALVVEDVQRVLGEVASTVYGHPSFTVEVVGVTGTNGKTTVTHLVAEALNGAAGFATCGVIGTVGAQLGDWSVPTSHTTPEADELTQLLAAMRSRGAGYAAIEVSSHALVQHRVRGVRLQVAALTNLTQDHLDFHGSMQAYRDAKASLFREHAPGVEVLNIDDAFGKQLASERMVPTISVSCHDRNADVYAERRSVTAAGISADVRVDGRLFSLQSRLVGAHNLENLLMAIGIARALDADLERSVGALSLAGGVPGRLERCDRQPSEPLVLVDYAHTPDALQRALVTCRSLVPGRLTCVFGCGGDRDRTKRPLMGELAARLADVAIITNDNPRSEDPAAIAREIDQGRGYAIELDREKAIDLAIASSGPGDCVLIAGKGHETYQVIGAHTSHFDDREVARAALFRHHGSR